MWGPMTWLTSQESVAAKSPIFKGFLLFLEVRLDQEVYQNQSPRIQEYFRLRILFCYMCKPIKAVHDLNNKAVNMI